MQPVGPFGQAGGTGFNQNPREPENARQFADQQAQGDARWQRCRQIAKGHARQHDARIAKGKQRHDQEFYIRCQSAFQCMQGRFAKTIFQRHEKRSDDPGQRGMHTGLQHQNPQHAAQQNNRRDAVRPQAVVQKQARKRDQGKGKIGDIQLGGIEHSDDDNRAKIIQNGQCQQKNLQRGGRAFSQQRQHADGKGNVGGGGYGPAGQGGGAVPVQCRKDQCWHRHAAQCRKSRQEDIARVAQFAFQHLAL